MLQAGVSMVVRVIFLALLCCCLSSNAFACLEDDWPLDRLVQKSDLVVIASPLENRSTGKMEPIDQYVSIDERNIKTPILGERYELQLQIFAVIKGSSSGDLLTLVTRKFTEEPPKENQVIRGFGCSPTNLSVELGKKKLYLFFLKNSKDGMFELTAGQQHTSIESVVELKHEIPRGYLK